MVAAMARRGKQQQVLAAPCLERTFERLREYYARADAASSSTQESWYDRRQHRRLVAQR
jgi:hypothetical protein